MVSVQTRVTSIKDMRKFLDDPDVPAKRDYKESLAITSLPVGSFSEAGGLAGGLPGKA